MLKVPVQLLKAALVIIISCGVEEYWGIVLMQESLLQGRHRPWYLK